MDVREGVRGAADLLELTDWSASPLGPRPSWPAALGGIVRTMLGAPVPMALVAGPQLTLLYNDDYARVLGAKHPDAFGRPVTEVLAENWSKPGHGDRVEHVYATGEPFFEAETLLPVRRQGPAGPVEQVHFSRAYTAVRDEDGRILGVLTVISESTQVTRALAAIAELASRLASALSVDDVAREVMHHAVHALRADHARVVLAEGPALRMTRRGGLDLDDESVDRLPPVWVRIPSSTSLPSVEVVRERRPLWLGPAELGRYTALQDEPTGGQRLASVASVPVHTGPVQGALSFGWLTEHTFGSADRAALTTIGNLVGQALARAQRFDEQRGHAETLQRNMLPADLPHVDGMSIGARYQPSAPGTSAGGDFYDAFELGDGRIVLTLGDVVGHGVLAAAVMGQVRAALRVLALRDPDPVQVLAGLDPFVASLGPETFVTAVVGVLDVATGDLTLATAGHPAPLVRRGPDAASGLATAEFVAVPPAPPLGIPAARTAVSTRLRQGDVLLMFTDGLVEVAGRDLGEGLDELRRLVLDHVDVRDARRLCTLLTGQLGTGDDDVAVVAVTMDDGSRRTAAKDLPGESSAPAAARRWAEATLGAWGCDDDVTQTALLCLSELVTNALLHARSGARVELDLDDHRLLVLVGDTGMAPELAIQGLEPTALRGRGLLLVEAMSDAWGSEPSSRGTTVWFEIARSRPR